MYLELAGVDKIYNRGEANEVIALHGVNLGVDRGQLVVIQGPSGSGKTTLLSIIGCLFPPTSGRVTLAGKKISRLPDHFMTRYRREMVGFVFQHPNMLGQLSLLENVTLPLFPLGLSPRVREKKADELLTRYGILHRRNFPVRQLSGGELQRAALVRALINDPQLIVADEPTAHLDSGLSVSVIDLLAAQKEDNRTIIITSHDPLVIGHDGVDRVISIRDGRLQGGGGR